MGSRKLVEPARSRRIAHLDLRGQMEKRHWERSRSEPTRCFFRDLDEFLKSFFRKRWESHSHFPLEDRLISSAAQGTDKSRTL